MTSNQLEYNKQVEQHRSNLANEALTERNLVENERHNLASELHNEAVLGETTRHNKVTENQAAQNLEFNYASLGETQRHNEAQEKELHRSNLENERIKEDLGWANIDVATQANQIKSDYNVVSLQLQQDTLNETIRANQAREAQVWEQNRLREQELQESIARRESEMRIREQQLESDVRLRESTLQEQIRSNTAGESIRRQANKNEAVRNAEVKRHNQENEKAQTWSNINGSVSSFGQVLRAGVPLFLGGYL